MKRKIKLTLTIICCLAIEATILAVGVDGLDNSSKTVKFTNYSNGYSFSASALSGWIITSGGISGGTSGSWDYDTNEGDKKFPCNTVTATGTRAAGGSSTELFFAILEGSIKPTGTGGSPRTYSYSVTANFSGVISVDPYTKTVPLNGGGQAYKLLTTYDGVAHHIYGYWKTDPDYRADSYDWYGTSYYGGICSFPGIFTIQGAAHSDGGDQATAELKVSAVNSVTGSSNGSSQTSSTDGWERDDLERYIKDDQGNNKTQVIPTVYAKQGLVLTLSASPYSPPGVWPTYISGEETLSYPTWSVNQYNSSSYFDSTNGASTFIIAEKAFGSMQINANCGNSKKINAKFIRLKFGKNSIFASWNIHETLNISQFLAGNSSFTGCADPSTCTNLDCNHRGCYDQNHFAWSVSGDAQLKLSKGDGTTVYAQSFSPAAEAAKTDTNQKLSFTGNIRFTKPSLITTYNITVTATSEELTSETDTLTITPQYINLVVAGADEEEYDELGTLVNVNTNEGSIGAFVKINDNDSNDDKNVDREKNTEASASDSDLLAVTVNKQINGTIDADHPITLTLGGFSGGGSSIKVWKDASRSELYLDSSGTKQFTSAGDLGPFYIEAVGSTSATLSVSYTYPNSTTEPNPNTDYSSTNYYSIDSCGDNIRLNGFGVDIDLAGLDDEKTVEDNGTTVRVLPYEMFPGGEVEVKPDVNTTLDVNNQVAFANGTLTSVTLGGSNFIRALTLSEGETNPDLTRSVTFTSASDKIKLYEPVMSGTTHQTNASGVPLYKVFTGGGLKVSDLSKTIYMLPVKDSASKRDVELKMSYTSPQNEVTHEDVIKLTCLMLDLDVDSNNNGTVEKDNIEEDKIETTAPGKMIKLNDSDLDGDSIVDNVDYNINGNGFSDNIFAEMILRIPQSIDLNNCKITLSYDASTPPATEGGTLATTGSIRVWKKMSNTTRDPKPVGGTNQTGDVGGDYIMPTNWTVQSGEEAYYTPAQLLGEGREVTLYVEGAKNTTSSSVTITITPITERTGNETDLTEAIKGPESYNLSDTVLFTSISLTVTHLAFNHNRSGHSSDGINMRQNVSANNEVRAPEYIVSGGSAPTLPTGVTGNYNQKMVLYKKSAAVTVYARFTIQPTSITSVNLYATGYRKKLDGTSGTEGLSIAGLGNSSTGTAVTFSSGISSGIGTITIDGVAGFVSLNSQNNTASVVLREEASFQWFLKGINGNSSSTVMPMEITAKNNPILIYTVWNTPLAPWNTSDTTGDDENQPWENALEFAFDTCEAGNKATCGSNSNINTDSMAAITKSLHDRYSYPSDTASNYIYSIGSDMFFNYTDYIDKTDSTANCDDSAAGLSTTFFLLGIGDAKMKKRSPFHAPTWAYHCFVTNLSVNYVYDCTRGLFYAREPYNDYLNAEDTGGTGTTADYVTFEIK